MEHHLESGSSPEASDVSVSLAKENRQTLSLDSVPKKKGKVVLISSSFLGEGKSHILRQLAAVTAMLGQRTLIIDADVRQGEQTSFFGLNKQSGLTETVGDRGKSLANYHKTLSDNLSILPTGNLTNNFLTAIESPSMRAFIDEAANKFDWVFIDSSPITSCPELITLSQQTQGVLLVVSSACPSKHEVKKATSEFQQSGGNILGMVFNESGQIENNASLSPFSQPKFNLPFSSKAQPIGTNSSYK